MYMYYVCIVRVIYVMCVLYMLLHVLEIILYSHFKGP